MNATRLLPIALLLAATPALAVQDPPDADQVPDKREEIKQMIERFEGHAKERGEQDEEAVAVIDQLYQEFPNSGPKDRQDIVDALEDVFKLRRKELEEGVPDNRLYMAAAVALKDMGPESVKPLIALLEAKNIKDDLAVRRRVILSLGETAHPKGMEPLADLLKDHEPQIQGAAAEALGEFEGRPQEDRKELFGELLKTLMTVLSAMQKDPQDLVARERYDTIAGPIITSLQRLSGHDERDPAKWQAWWNDHKRDNWDEKE